MSSRYDQTNDPDWLLDGSPAFRASNLRPIDCTSDAAALTTAVMTSVAVPLNVGEVVTSLSFLSGATAADTPLNWWFALYSPAGALLAQTADQTTTAWAADTLKTLALATPQTLSATGVYYAAVMVKATAPPTLVGRTLARAAAAGALLSSKVLARTSGSALTTTAPATIATPTTIAAVPLCIIT